MPTEPISLAERLNRTRGVDKLMRVIVDGASILAEDDPLEDQIQRSDLADAPQRAATPAERSESPMAGEEDQNPAQVGAVLRKMRRGRR